MPVLAAERKIASEHETSLVAGANRRLWPAAVTGTVRHRYVPSCGSYLAEAARTQQADEESERELSGLRSEVYSLAVLVRDYLREDSPDA